jgi:hypothetical protein
MVAEGRYNSHTLFVYNVKLVQPQEAWPGDLVFVTSSTELTLIGCLIHQVAKTVYSVQGDDITIVSGSSRWGAGAAEH